MKRPKLSFQTAPVSFWQEMFGEQADWPQFVQELRGASGVYVIRSKDDKRVLYVGESHTGRLKKTLLRHFQNWTGKTAGPTYSRNSVEISVTITPPSKAVEIQNDLIAHLNPRDNRISPDSPKQSGEDEPF